MANNRLYIVDTDLASFCIAKSFNDGWVLYDPETLVERLQQWLANRDPNATLGAIAAPTELRLLTEGQLLIKA